MEEHYVILEEPNSKYIEHISPDNGSAQAIEMITFLSQKIISTHEIIAIGCDGTAVNTGKKNGVITKLKNNFQRPLQWIICLLHANELPLRHLIEEIDGKTGLKSFQGPIGRLLSSCHEQEIVEYESIPAEEIDCNPADLSTDVVGWKS